MHALERSTIILFNIALTAAVTQTDRLIILVISQPFVASETRRQYYYVLF